MGLTYIPTTKHAAFYGIGYASASEAGIVADQQAMVASSEAQAHRDLKMATIRRCHKARESRHSPAGTTRSNSKMWLDYHRAGRRFDLGSQAGEGQAAPPTPTTTATSRQRHRRLPPSRGPPPQIHSPRPLSPHTRRPPPAEKITPPFGNWPATTVAKASGNSGRGGRQEEWLAAAVGFAPVVSWGAMRGVTSEGFSI
jgi:hypothetical protein